MTAVQLATPFAALASIAYLLVFHVTDTSAPIRAIIKIAPITLLFIGCLIDWTSLELREKLNTRYILWIACGLFFSAGGDVLLELGNSTFLPGLGSFLVAHLFYIAAFSLKTPLALLRGAIFYALGGVMFGVLLPTLSASFVAPVLCYTLAIATMGHRAAARFTAPAGQASQGSRVSALVGAVFFLVSDSLIAVNKFHTTIPNSKFYVMITYYLAQLLIARSTVRCLTRLEPTPELAAGPNLNANLLEGGVNSDGQRVPKKGE